MCSDSDAKPPQLTLKAAAAMIPHPEKADRGGEDAYFISEDGLTLGDDSFQWYCFKCPDQKL